MILTCPECRTRYLLDPASLGRSGRSVRCAKCGHQWHQAPPDDLPQAVMPEAADETASGYQRPPDAGLPAPLGGGRKRRGATAWVLLVVVIAVVVVAGYAGRTQIVEAWPEAEGIYSALGVPVGEPGSGLDLQGVVAELRTENGVDVLVVEGRIVNLTDRERPVPLLRAIVLGGGGEALGTWTFTARTERLQPGEVATFQTVKRDPAPGVAEAQVTFADY